MKNTTWALITIVSVLSVVGSFGCSSMSEYLTPATVNKEAIAYAAEAGVIDANDFRGWQNLDKAIRLATAVDAAYQVNDLALKQMMEKNQLDYSILSSTVKMNLEAAQARESNLFGETGVLSLLAGLVGFGGLGTALGKFLMKRPGDMTAADVEAVIAPIRGEATDKEKQFIQVVKGVQKFMDAKKGDEQMDLVIAELKSYLGSVQDEKTKQEVAKAKVVV